MGYCANCVTKLSGTKVKGENSGCMADKLVERSLLKRTNKLQRKKELVTQMRKIDVSTDMLGKVVDEHKEKWRQELQDIERRRNDLLPEHQKMQKLSQKLQSVQDKKKTVPEERGQMC